MRILLATDTYMPTINGVVTSTVTLKESLIKQGHDVRVLTLGKTDAIDYENHIYTLSSFSLNKVYPGARVTLPALADRHVIKDIYEWQPEIIHTQCEFSTFRIACHIADVLNIPIVHTYHTVYEDYTHYFSPNKTWGKKFVSYMTRRVLGATEAVIAPTEKVENLLHSYGVEQPISVIPTGIFLDRFDQKLYKVERSALRQKYNIPDDHFLLVTIGRIAKEKNIDEIIDFLSEMNEEKISFLIVGDGPYREDLEEKVAQSSVADRIHFTGMIDPAEVPNYYQLGDVFVSGSTSETQGLTYIEAMASGLPALCHHDASLSNVIIDNINGYQYRDFSEFKYQLELWMHDKKLRDTLAKNAYLTAHNRYSAEAFSSAVEKLYEQTLEIYASKQMNSPRIFLS